MSQKLNVDHVYFIAHPIFEAKRIEYLKTHVVPYLQPDQYTFVTPFWKGQDSTIMFNKNIHPQGLRHHLTDAAGFLYLTFYKIMNLFLKSSHEVVLIFESDIQVHHLPDGQWVHEMNQSINDWKLIQGWKNSMVFCGNGCGLQAPLNAKRAGRLVEMNSSKCCDSMLWTKPTIEAICKNIFPIVAPIDWFLNFWFADQKPQFKAYCLEPYVFVQGSQNGAYVSEVQY
jgi:hypothetical protein